MAPVYLHDFARELRQIGEVGFRRRHQAPVLIVMSRVSRRGGADAEAVTRRVQALPVDRASASSALIHRVFPIVKAPDTPAGPISVGRTSDNDVVIPDHSISRRHCTFELGEGSMAIRDAGSTNGTLLGGSPLDADAAVPLCGGETLTIGRFTIVYETPSGFLELVSGLGD